MDTHNFAPSWRCLTQSPLRVVHNCNAIFLLCAPNRKGRSEFHGQLLGRAAKLGSLFCVTFGCRIAVKDPRVFAYQFGLFILGPALQQHGADSFYMTG